MYILHYLTIASKVAFHFRDKRWDWQEKNGIAIIMHKPQFYKKHSNNPFTHTRDDFYMKINPPDFI